MLPFWGSIVSLNTLFPRARSNAIAEVHGHVQRAVNIRC